MKNWPSNNKYPGVEGHPREIKDPPGAPGSENSPSTIETYGEDGGNPIAQDDQTTEIPSPPTKQESDNSQQKSDNGISAENRKKLDDLKNRNIPKEEGNQPNDSSDEGNDQGGASPSGDDSSGNNDSDNNDSTPYRSGFLPPTENYSSSAVDGQPGITVPKDEMDRRTNKHNDVLNNMWDKYGNEPCPGGDSSQESNEPDDGGNGRY